jgi:hypothetical protein
VTDQATDQQVHRFRPTNGRVTGVLGLVLCAFVAAAFVASQSWSVALPGVLACAFVAVLVWLAMLRPDVAATDSELRLRTMAETVVIPMASIETVVVRRYLLVRSGGRRYICPAISRSLRKTVGAEMKWRPQQMFSPASAADRLADSTGSGAAPDQDLAYADFVEQRIAHLAASDRQRRGIEERSEEEYELGSQTVRRVARLELGALAVLAVAFVVALVAL